MTHDEFMQYHSIIKQDAFRLIPDPDGIDRRDNNFVYADDNRTHVIIKGVATQNQYHLPLVLVEFISPGVVRLTRKVKADEGNLV